MSKEPSIRHNAQDGVETAGTGGCRLAKRTEDALEAAADEDMTGGGIDRDIGEGLHERITMTSCPTWREHRIELYGESIDVSYARGQIRNATAHGKGGREVAIDDDVAERINGNAEAHLVAVRNEGECGHSCATRGLQGRDGGVPRGWAIVAREAEASDIYGASKCGHSSHGARCRSHVSENNIAWSAELVCP